MNLPDQIWLHYLELPRKNTEPVKVNKILEQRIKKYRYMREARLMAFGDRIDGSNRTNQ